MDLKGKTVLVVGAGRGIGRSTAESFSSAGADVVISSRSKTELMELEHKLRKNDGTGEILLKTADWTNEDDVENLVGEAVNRFGGIDYLVLSAGKGILKPFDEITLDTLSELMAANTYGAFNVLKRVLPLMKEKRSGRIVAIPGILGKVPMAHASAYCAAKYALTGLIKSLKEEYKRFGIRFTLMHLGGVDTSFWDDIDMNVKRSKLLTADAASTAIFNAATQEGEGVMAEVVLLPEFHQVV